MENGKSLIELAGRIPIRNLNFYIDACREMSAVRLQEISGHDEGERTLGKLKDIIAGEGLKANPQAAIEAIINYLKDSTDIDASNDTKLLGKFIILYLRQGEFNEGTGHLSKLPFNFLSYAVVEDLKLHGQGPSYSFVEKFLDDLAASGIIAPDFHSLLIKDRCSKYTDQDMAAIFLGYSLASKGSVLSIVPFPAKPAGFVAVLITELKKLLPRRYSNRFIKSSAL